MDNSAKSGLLISTVKRENINDFLNQQFLYKKFKIPENK
jgi:hypothetical protein